MNEDFKLSLRIDGINTVRGTNQIIIYTYDKRNANNKTGTNEYGYEVAIDLNNRVCEKGTHVSFCENGIIISAHGENGDIFSDKIEIGDRLFYSTDTNSIVFTREIKDIALRLKNKIKFLKEKLHRFETGLYDLDFDSLKTKLSIIENSYQKVEALIIENQDISKVKINDLENKLHELEIQLFPSIVIESRGCWHRPNVLGTEHTLEGIEAILSEMKEVGINSVYVETFWWGRSISNSKIAFYHPRVMNGNYGDYEDYLSAFIDIAHKMDMEVHAWTETFFIGGEVKEQVPPWIEGREHWMNTTYKGGHIQTGKGTEEGFIFLDPTNPEVKDFLISYYKELSKYNLDGIQLDYIRYPHEDNLETSSGYTEYAMNKFMEEIGLEKADNLKELLLDNDKLFTDWKNFRKKHVSNFVELAVKEIKKVNPNILISIAVGSDPEIAKNILLQDWPSWVNNGLIDIIAPMAYSRDIDYIKGIVRKMNGISKGITYNYTGIGTYMEFPEIENVRQMMASRTEMGLGSVMFASQYLIHQDKLKKVLKNGIFQKEAITPNTDIEKLLSVSFQDILDKIDRIYLVKKEVTLEFRKMIESEFNRIKETGNNLKICINQISKLVDIIPRYANNEAKERLIEDLIYLKYILNIKLNKKEMKK
ncbi:family 10 glycosylhydrolase [Mycoplasmatota bacterium]|nr:family 10 glycosylhydrolase [Mycoplasmatota bacterium]